jgi:hypothetical protein
MKNADNNTFKTYIATKQKPNIVGDLTADLTAARSGEVIKSAKFNQSSVSPYARSQADFSKIILYF